MRLIQQTGSGRFIAASEGCWLPGVYATRQAATYALQLTDEQLAALSDRVCHVTGENRTITTDDLRSTASSLGVGG